MLIKTDIDTTRSYFEDSSNIKGGHADKVLIPENEREISEILKKANRDSTPVTISGGGTGTTASRIAFGGIVVSTERLNSITEISSERKSATVQAGVTVESLKEAADRKGLFYTSHPTEKTAFIGGTIATNASGSRSFKYGSTRACVKRLRMVLATGDIYEIKRGVHTVGRDAGALVLPGLDAPMPPMPTYIMPNVKNASGYFARAGMDPIDLFIGQEGTLSVITEAEMSLVKKPAKILSCFVFFTKEEDAWRFSEGLKKAAGLLDILSIEYFDHNAVTFLRGRNGNVPDAAASAIFFEEELSDGDETALMDKRVELIVKHGGSPDNTWVAMTDKEAEEFNNLRYAIPETVNEMFRRAGYYKLATDIAVPEKSFIEMMSFYVEAFKKSDLKHVVFGHISECHVHANILPSTDEELLRAKKLALAFVRKGISLGGTVSAEHGIGKIKKAYLEEMYGRKGLIEMARVKKALDPGWILGLDNIFPKELVKEI
jgi:D-lactate dehydrogenase (cytochrome)